MDKISGPKAQYNNIGPTAKERGRGVKLTVRNRSRPRYNKDWLMHHQKFDHDREERSLG
jgi:hypothetical protein